MNREDIIRMAREAGLWETRHSVEMAIGGVGELEDFAKLIAEHEREACAKIVENESLQYTSPVWAFEIVNDIRAR
jgi:hypothetical protein